MPDFHIYEITEKNRKTAESACCNCLTVNLSEKVFETETD